MKREPQPFPTEEQLREWLDYWQCVLSLRDWTIEIRYCRRRELDDQSHFAELWSNLENKFATIRIQQEADYDPESEAFEPGNEDFEETVVHELLHLHFPSRIVKIDEDAYDVLYEQGINLTARAFVRMRRLGNDVSTAEPNPVQTRR